MIAALVPIVYILTGLLTTWFNYEMLKTLSETGKRIPTDKSSYRTQSKWEVMDENGFYLFVTMFNTAFWPITTPALWIGEWARKRNSPVLSNPMRWAVKELVDPKDNV